MDATLTGRYSYDVLLGVFVRRDQVDGLHVAEIYVVAQHEDVQQLANVLLAIVS